MTTTSLRISSFDSDPHFRSSEAHFRRNDAIFWLQLFQKSFWADRPQVAELKYKPLDEKQIIKSAEQPLISSSTYKSIKLIWNWKSKLEKSIDTGLIVRIEPLLHYFIFQSAPSQKKRGENGKRWRARN
jgi:hypothetical protein